MGRPACGHSNESKSRHARATLQGTAASAGSQAPKGLRTRGPRTSHSRRRPRARGTRPGCLDAAHRLLSHTMSATSAQADPHHTPHRVVLSGQPAPGSRLSSSPWSTDKAGRTKGGKQAVRLISEEEPADAQRRQFCREGPAQSEIRSGEWRIRNPQADEGVVLVTGAAFS